jgi:hypothetical protein
VFIIVAFAARLKSCPDTKRVYSTHTTAVIQKFIEEQQQILRLTTPRLKSTPGAPFAQDDSIFVLRIMSLLQNNQETGITYSCTPSELWFVPTAKLVLHCMVPPHPYFGRKVVVLLLLQTGVGCKVVKTKELFAKSSRIRS